MANHAHTIASSNHVFNVFPELAFLKPSPLVGCSAPRYRTLLATLAPLARASDLPSTISHAAQPVQASAKVVMAVALPILDTLNRLTFWLAHSKPKTYGVPLGGKSFPSLKASQETAGSCAVTLSTFQPLLCRA